MRKHLLAALAAAAMTASPLTINPAIAEVAYDSLGADDTHSNGGNWFGKRSCCEGSYSVAAGFTPLVVGRFDEFWLAMDSPVSDQVVNLRLTTDPNGSLGDTLWSQTFVGQLDWGIFHVEGLAGPILQTHSAYWLVAEQTYGAESSTWWRTNKGVGGGVGLKWNDEPWDTFDCSHCGFAMRIAVEPIPEPSTLVMLAAGLAMLWFWVGRRFGNGGFLKPRQP